jgi:hypothetical protein
MSQVELFAAQPVHYGPKPSADLPNWRRVALCGVTFRVAGDLADPPEPLGSSSLEFVTCGRCRELATK